MNLIASDKMVLKASQVRRQKKPYLDFEHLYKVLLPHWLTISARCAGNLIVPATDSVAAALSFEVKHAIAPRQWTQTRCH